MPTFYTGRHVLDGSSVAELLTADDWVQVTLISSASGTTFSSKQGGSSGTGVPLPADVPITFYMDPGSRLWAFNSSAGATVGVIVQGLPLNLRIMRMVAAVLERFLPASMVGGGACK